MDDHLRSKVEETIFKETSTLGIRIKSVNRVEANREIRKFQSSYGIVSIKISSHAGEIFSVSPEYDDCRLISLKEGLPIANVMRQIKNEAENSILC